MMITITTSVTIRCLPLHSQLNLAPSQSLMSHNMATSSETLPNFQRPWNSQNRLPFFLSFLLPSFHKRTMSKWLRCSQWQKRKWRYSCQSVSNLEHNISPELSIFSGIRHCYTVVELCYVTVRQTDGQLSCQFLANRDTTKACLRRGRSRGHAENNT